MMVADNYQNHLEKLRSFLSVLVYPIQYGIDVPIDAARWLAENAASQKRLSQENARLREQNFVLRSHLQKLSSLEAENMRLRELLDSSLKLDGRVLVADLLAVELESYRRQVVIDKGSTHGVFLGQPIFHSDGVMGQIVHVAPLTSTAMLITDRDHAIPIQVTRNGLRALAVGNGSRTSLDLAYVANNADIRVGDLLVTSGLGGRFPPGYPVGVVDKVELDPAQPYASIVIKPTAKLAAANQVLLIWPEPTALGPGEELGSAD